MLFKLLLEFFVHVPSVLLGGSLSVALRGVDDMLGFIARWKSRCSCLQQRIGIWNRCPNWQRRLYGENWGCGAQLCVEGSDWHMLGCWSKIRCGGVEWHHAVVVVWRIHIGRVHFSSAKVEQTRVWSHATVTLRVEPLRPNIIRYIPMSAPSSPEKSGFYLGSQMRPFTGPRGQCSDSDDTFNHGRVNNSFADRDKNTEKGSADTESNEAALRAASRYGISGGRIPKYNRRMIHGSFLRTTVDRKAYRELLEQDMADLVRSSNHGSSNTYMCIPQIVDFERKCDALIVTFRVYPEWNPNKIRALTAKDIQDKNVGVKMSQRLDDGQRDAAKDAIDAMTAIFAEKIAMPHVLAFNKRMKSVGTDLEAYRDGQTQVEDRSSLPGTSNQQVRQAGYQGEPTNLQAECGTCSSTLY